MVLRLILVGLVAGLGLSLPSQRDLETLHRSAQRWVEGRLKGDAPRTPDADGVFVFVADESPTTPIPTLTPAPAPATAPTQDPDRAPAETLDEVADVPADDDSPAEVVPPLRVAEAPAPAFGSPPLDDLLLAAPTEPAAEVVETKTAEAIPAEAETEIDVADIEAEITGAEIAEAEPVDPDRDFLTVVDEMAAAFAADLALMRDREAEATRLAQAAPEGEAPEVGEDLYPGLAYALNREAEGLDLAPRPRRRRPSRPSRRPRRPPGCPTPSG